jgi:hypothetical protein
MEYRVRNLWMRSQEGEKFEEGEKRAGAGAMRYQHRECGEWKDCELIEDI